MDNFIISAFGDEIDPSLDIQMDVLEKHKVSYIETRGIDGRNVASFTIDEAKEIKKRLDKRGFKVSAIGSPIGKIGITDDFEPHFVSFKNILAIAKIFETDYVRMFSFYIPKEDKPAKWRDEVLMRLKSFAREAEKENIMLLHENEKGIYGDIPERCKDIVESVGSPKLKLIFDPANFVQDDISIYPFAFNMLRDYVIYLHMKDSLYKDKSIVPCGYGDAQIPEVIKALKESGFHGFLSIEPHLGNFQGYAQLQPESDVNKLPDSGTKLFAMAHEALMRLL